MKTFCQINLQNYWRYLNHSIYLFKTACIQYLPGWWSAIMQETQDPIQQGRLLYSKLYHWPINQINLIIAPSMHAQQGQGAVRSQNKPAGIAAAAAAALRTLSCLLMLPACRNGFN